MVFGRSKLRAAVAANAGANALSEGSKKMKEHEEYIHALKEEIVQRDRTIRGLETTMKIQRDAFRNATTVTADAIRTAQRTGVKRPSTASKMRSVVRIGNASSKTISTPLVSNYGVIDKTYAAEPNVEVLDDAFVKNLPELRLNLRQADRKAVAKSMLDLILERVGFYIDFFEYTPELKKESDIIYSKIPDFKEEQVTPEEDPDVLIARLGRMVQTCEFKEAKKLAKKLGTRCTEAKVEDGSPALIHLVSAGNVEMVAHFLRFGGDPNVLGLMGESCLHVIAGLPQEDSVSLELVRILIDKHNACTTIMLPEDGLLPLHLAVLNSNLKLIEMMVARTPDGTESKTAFGDYPLHIASASNLEDAVLLLRMLGANPDTRNAEGKRAYECAAPKSRVAMLVAPTGFKQPSLDNSTTRLLQGVDEGDDEVVKDAFAEGANPEAMSMNGKPALYNVISNGYKKCMQLFLDNGAYINRNLFDGQTPLHLAATIKNGEFRSASMVRELLLRGANAELPMSEMELTPIHCSILAGNVAAMGLLAPRTLMSLTAKKDTPLHMAATVGSVTMVKHLLYLGANDRARNDIHKTALEMTKSEDVEKLLKTVPPQDFNEPDELVEPCSDPDQSQMMQKTIRMLAAIRAGDMGKACWLLKWGAFPDWTASSGRALIHIATKQANYMLLHSLLMAGALVNAQDAAGQTALHYACQQQSDDVALEMVAALLHYGANPAIQTTRFGFSALHVAILHGLSATAALLLPQSDIHARTFFGDTALHLATSMGDVNLVGRILGQGAEPMAKNNHDKTAYNLVSDDVDADPELLDILDEAERASAWRALVDAAGTGNVSKIEELLGKYGDLQFIENDGVSALSRAIDNLQADAIEILLLRGAAAPEIDSNGRGMLHFGVADGKVCNVMLNFNKALAAMPDRSGALPIHYAAHYGCPESIFRLIRAGTNVNVRTEAGETPLHVAGQSGSVHCITTLLDLGCDPMAQAQDGTLAIDCAANSGNTHAVDLLRNALLRLLFKAIEQDNVSDINDMLQIPWLTPDLPDEAGDPPITFATAKDSVKAVKTLIEHRCNPDIANANGDTAIHLACESDRISHLEITEMLITEAKSVLSRRNMHGLTPLHVAVQKRKLETVSLLLSAGPKRCDIDARALNGDTAFHIAVEYGELEICQKLAEFGANPNLCNRMNKKPEELIGTHPSELQAALLQIIQEANRHWNMLSTAAKERPEVMDLESRNQKLDSTLASVETELAAKRDECSRLVVALEAAQKDALAVIGEQRKREEFENQNMQLREELSGARTMLEEMSQDIKQLQKQLEEARNAAKPMPLAEQRQRIAEADARAKEKESEADAARLAIRALAMKNQSKMESLVEAQANHEKLLREERQRSEEELQRRLSEQYRELTLIHTRTMEDMETIKRREVVNVQSEQKDRLEMLERERAELLEKVDKQGRIIAEQREIEEVFREQQKQKAEAEDDVVKLRRTCEDLKAEIQRLRSIQGETKARLQYSDAQRRELQLKVSKLELEQQHLQQGKDGTGKPPAPVSRQYETPQPHEKARWADAAGQKKALEQYKKSITNESPFDRMKRFAEKSSPMAATWNPSYGVNDTPNSTNITPRPISAPDNTLSRVAD